MGRPTVIFIIIFTGIFVSTPFILYSISTAPLENFFGLLSVICYVLTLIPGIFKELLPRLKYKHTFLELLKYRRYFGVATFGFGIEHGILILTVNQVKVFDWQTYINYFQGYLILGVLMLLAGTSNDESVGLLKKNWKRLHRLTYLVPVLLLWHVLTKMTLWTWMTPVVVWLIVLIIIGLIFKIASQQNRLS